jgi:hypothetical protein
METKREEAAPTFPTWRRRLEEAPEEQRQEEAARFLQVLKAVGTPMIDGSAVHFVHYDPEARHVSLVGEFNEWNRRGIAMTPLRDTGFFYHTMQVRGPARVEYKLVVDGEWETDPLCPNAVENGIGEQNSFFVVGDFHEPPELEVNPAISRANCSTTVGVSMSTSLPTTSRTRRNGFLPSMSTTAVNTSPAPCWRPCWII